MKKLRKLYRFRFFKGNLQKPEIQFMEDVFLPIAISSWLEMKAAVLFPGFFGIQFVFTCSNSIKLSKSIFQPL